MLFGLVCECHRGRYHDFQLGTLARWTGVDRLVAGGIVGQPVHPVARRVGEVFAVLVLALGPIAQPASTTSAQGPATEYQVLAGQASGITAGPDGNVWFTVVCCPNDAIGRISPQGAITQFPLRAGASPLSITLGPDGNLWFTEGWLDVNLPAIGRITPAGVITEFPVPSGCFLPRRIVAGSDGNLWFIVSCSGGVHISRITPTGTVVVFPFASNFLSGLASGPDGNVWFAEDNRIGRITPAGEVNDFPLPGPSGVQFGITSGPDGNLWFAESLGRKIGRMTPSGVLTEFPLGAPHAPISIARANDGNLWFTDLGSDQLGRITPDGTITEFSDPTFTFLDSIAEGPDGNLWFTRAFGGIGRIGRFSPPRDGLSSLGLNGSSAYAEVPGADDLNLTRDWTIEAWFKDEDANGFNHDYVTLLSKGERGAGPESPYFVSLGFKRLVAGLRSKWTDHTVAYDLRAAGVEPRRWHHVGATFAADSGTLILYLDGTRVAIEQIASSSTGNNQPLAIGRNGASSGKYLKGKLDDVRVWSVARSANDIVSNYQQQFVGAQFGLVGNWQFEEGGGTTTADSSGRHHDATLSAGATFSTDVHE